MCLDLQSFPCLFFVFEKLWDMAGTFYSDFILGLYINF